MATPTEVLNALKKLNVYYSKETPREKIQIYQDTLIDLEPEAIEYAVHSWIKKSPFFPRVSDLREAAYEYRGPVKTLDEEIQRLHDAFCKRQELDPTAWENLAKALDHAGRVYMAMNVRNKYKNYAGKT